MRRSAFIIIILVGCLILASLFCACVRRPQQTEFLISFETNGGSAIPSQRLTSTDTLVLPVPPTKDGFVFDGWYTDSNLKFKYNPNTFKINANATLYAAWVDVNLYPHTITAQVEGLTLRIYDSMTGLTPDQLSLYSDADVELSTFQAVKNDRVAVTVRVWKQGYRYKEGTLKANNEPITEGSFLMPAENVVIAFEIELINYTLSVNQAEHGEVYADKSIATFGEIVTLLTIPDYGYRVANLTFNNASLNNNSFIMPSNNVIIAATFTPISGPDYTVQTISVEGGSVLPAKTSAKYGEYVEVQTIAEEGYYLQSLSMNDKELTEDYFLMPDAPAALTAVFLPIDYDTQYQMNINRNIPYGSVYAPKQEYSCGETVTLSATSINGYELSRYLVGSTPIFGDNFVMPAHDVIVSAVFERKPFTLSSNITGVGGIGFSSGGNAYAGELIQLSLIPHENYILKPHSLLKNGVLLEQTYFVMPEEDVIISAEFVPINTGSDENNYSCTVTSTAGGTVSVSKTAADENDVIFITVSPDTGYRLKEGTLLANGAPCEDYFLMPSANVVIEAEFERVYPITFYHLSWGYAYADKEEAAEGETVRVFYGAFGNYFNGTVFVNGQMITEDSFEMPAQDVMLTASFDPITTTKYSITCFTSDNGSITADVTSANAGKAVNLTVTPDDGYRLESLYYIDQNEQTVPIQQSFIMPAESVGIRAVFIEDNRNLDFAEFFGNNKTIYMQNGGNLTYYATPNAIKEYLEDFDLQNYTVYISSILACDYLTDFVALKMEELSVVPFLMQKLGGVLESQSGGMSFSGCLYDNYLLITSCDDPSEDYALLRSGIVERENFLFYVRSDDSYGLLSIKNSYTLTSLAVPAQIDGRAVTRISKRAFSNSAWLISLSLGVATQLADETFYGLQNLERIDLSRVRSIGLDAFVDCLGLKGFSVSDNPVFAVDSSGYALYERYGDKKYGKLIRYAPATSPLEYSVHDNCEIIAGYAFFGANIASLYLRNTLELKDYALFGMNELTYLNSVFLERAGYRSIYWEGSNHLDFALLSISTITCTNGKALYKSNGEGGALWIRLSAISLLDSYRRSDDWSDFTPNFYYPTNPEGPYVVYFESNGGSYV
ncbi:MAG: InlB B-repeat-containing protein, partial [Clostridia bacterium]|nr:InlB B-repeat-containing protein [Clostridia bacterium]